MDYRLLIILINDGQKAKKERCMESIKEQSFKNIEIAEISPQRPGELSHKTLKEMLSDRTEEFVLFIHASDWICVDYCRTMMRESLLGTDIVTGECLEEMGDGLYYPNRTFNQNKLSLQGHELKNAYIKFASLDYSWNTLWNKIYKKEWLDAALKTVKTCDTEKELGRQVNSYISQAATSFCNVKNNYYIRNITEKTFLDYSKNKKDFFIKRYVKIEQPLYFEDIKKAILSPDIKTVSFDIFDTLILRPFLYPVDIFIVLDQYVNSLITSITDDLNFQKLRMSAESWARDKYKLKGRQEVTLQEIYEELQARCSYLKPFIEDIKKKELELELQFCYERKTGKELYDLALEAKKQVVFTSDMYLPVSMVEKILKKNGFNRGDLFVSSECMKTKSTGDLYTYMMKQIGKQPNEVMHIGDNMETDVLHAKEKGLLSFHLPRTEELFNNWSPHVYSGRYFARMFESRCGIAEHYDAKELFGIRCMMAVSANFLYDYPFIIYDKSSDFNGNPYNIGYFTLGMHLYAVCRWLVDENTKNKYDCLHFMARDGYLVKNAFEMLNNLFGSDSKLYYTYMSRKALMPLMLQSKEDCYNLMNGFNGVQMTPKTVFQVIAPVIHLTDEDTLEMLCSELGISYNKPIGSQENFLKLSELIAVKLFDKEKAKSFNHKFRELFDKQFSGKAATFDLGYSARCESILKENFGYDITANYIHTVLDKAYQRSLKSGVKVNCFYDFTPVINGIARELLMSELTGSCIGYEWHDNKMAPVFENCQIDSSTHYAVQFMQNGAMAFIKDMIRIFGDYNKKLLIRNYYASIPFDYYLSFSSAFDRSFFSDTTFEDDMGLGNGISFEDFWSEMIYGISGGLSSRINYQAFGRIRQWILMLISLDLGELKRRVKGKLCKHKLIYNLVSSCYKSCRKGYHKTILKK